MGILNKGKQDTTKAAPVSTKKNHVEMSLKDSSGSSAEVKIDSDSSLKSEKVYRKAIEKIMSQTNWINGDYTFICKFSGSETGHEVHNVTIIKKGDTYDISFQPDEEATTMLEAELLPNKQKEAQEEEFVTADSTEDIEDSEEASTGEVDRTEESPGSEDMKAEEEAKREAEEAEAERIAREAREAEEAQEARERELQLERERMEAERRERERLEREEARRREREDGAGLASVIKPRSREAITSSVSVLSDRVLNIAREEEEYIIPLEKLVGELTLKDYAKLKKRMFDSESFVQERINKYIMCNTDFNSLTELELEDPSKAALLLLSFENLCHVMSNLRVLQAVFPDMEERTIRTMSPKSFGLQGKWDDPYEGKVLR